MGSKAKVRGNDLKQEEVLQAIVVADSFNVRFGPVTEKKPRALLPVVNVPMLDYTLDYLASQGVQETYLFCSHLANDIRAHIKESKYDPEDGRNTMTVNVILAAGSHTLGDGLREINTRNLIRNNFFLLSCDIVTNVDLKEVMEKHKAILEKDKTAVMTMNCMKMKPADLRRSAEDNILLGTDPNTQQVKMYHKATHDRKMKIKLGNIADVRLHQDLMDGQLYVCSPLVLDLFTDNFDYGTLDDFINGIIINEEIFGNTIHLNVLRNKYCARITSPYMYDVISQDILQRRTEPFNPEVINLSIGVDVKCHDRNVYHHPDLTLPRTVELKQNVVIGTGSTIQPGTHIENSVIGHNCTIGAGVRMKNCYLWGSVTIEDGCVLDHAILCDGVVVYANTTVQPQTILSWNVKVGPNVKLPQGARLQDTPPTDEFADEEEQEVPDVTPEFGAKSKAFLYVLASEDSDDDDDDADPFAADWGDPLISAGSDDDDDDMASSINASDLDDDDDDDVDEDGRFYAELEDTLKRAKDEKVSMDNLILEVNSLKHAYNIAIKEVHQAVMKVLVELPLTQHPQSTGKDLLTTVLRHVGAHLGLLRNYIKNAEAQMDCLHALEDLVVDNERALSVLSSVVHFLYEKDVLEEGVICRWYDTEADEDEEEDHARIRRQVDKFITWLREADEESSEEDD